jgi:hypothetical protein
MGRHKSRQKKSCFHYFRSSPPPPERRVGFCRYHHWYMTAKSVKAKGCLEKNCWYLVKWKQHPWWEQRELRKQRGSQDENAG